MWVVVIFSCVTWGGSLPQVAVRGGHALLRVSFTSCCALRARVSVRCGRKLLVVFMYLCASCLGITVLDGC